MKTFSDSQGQAWTIALPFGDVRRVKDASAGEFDLLYPGRDQLAERLDADPMLFYDLLRILCEPQATSLGINPEEFGRRMAADCLLVAQRTFFEVWRDFFHQLQRVDQARGLELLATQKAKALELLTAKMRQQEPLLKQLETKLQAEMESAVGTEFGKLQALLESPTPASSTSSPGDNSRSSTKAGSKRRGSS